MTTIRIHSCTKFQKDFFRTFGFTLESQGDGWYMYDLTTGNRSPKSYNYCPSCGIKLEEQD